MLPPMSMMLTRKAVLCPQSYGQLPKQAFILKLRSWAQVGAHISHCSQLTGFSHAAHMLHLQPLHVHLHTCEIMQAAMHSMQAVSPA